MNIPKAQKTSNKASAEAAAQVIHNYRKITFGIYHDDDPSNPVQTLITDLGHYCDEMNLDFIRILGGALKDFSDERIQERS